MRRVLVTAITLVSTAALASGATVTAAYASPHAGTPAAAQTTARTAAQPNQAKKAPQEHFRIITTTTASRRQSVLATGQFVAGGYLVPGQVKNLRSTDRMVFPSGSFRVARHITHQSLPLPTSRCLIGETIRGSYALSHGTGAFAGISGSGGFTLHIRGVIRKVHGHCGGPMTVFQSINYLGGPIHR